MRKAGHYSQTTIEIIIVTVIVVVVNFLGQYFFTRFDFTKDKEYTLASSTRDIVSSLNEYLHIKVYVSADLPPQVQQQEQTLQDLLEEYRAVASDKLTIQTIHTNDLSEEDLAAIEQRGIQKQQYRAVGAEEAQIQMVYMGLTLDYLDKHEVIPFTPTVPNLEYDITSAILKLTSKEQPTVGFLTGHGESSSSSSLAAITTSLKDLYDVQDVDLETGKPVPDAIKTLVIAGPTQPITERHKYVIDQFLMRGGKLVVLEPGFKFNQMNGQVEMQMNPLDSLLSSYGVKVNNDLIIDLSYNLQIPAGSMGGMRVIVPYPPIPMIAPPDGFPSESPATRGLTSLALPYVSSLQLLYDRIPKEMLVYELAKTSKDSYSHPLPVDVNPNQQFTPPGGQSDLKQQLVAVQLTGIFKSAFEGKQVPAFDPDPNAGADVLPQIDSAAMVAHSPETSIVVIGNSTLIEDYAVKNIQGNNVFFMNLMETLNLGDKLINIRTRTVTNRPLNPDLTSVEKNGLRFWGYGAIPVIITFLGIARFYLKAQRKRLLQAMQYAEKASHKG
jgi:gliding-associated putative ABC transporter substrate-binding component GldG